MRNADLFRGALEVADGADDILPPALAVQSPPAIVRHHCINCGAYTSARVAEWTDPDGDLWLGYGCKHCGYFDPIGLFDRRRAVAAGLAPREGDDDVPF